MPIFTDHFQLKPLIDPLSKILVMERFSSVVVKLSTRPQHPTLQQSEPDGERLTDKFIVGDMRFSLFRLLDFFRRNIGQLLLEDCLLVVSTLGRP